MSLNVFVINLDRQPKRWAFMEAQLAALGIRPIRIPAVDGKASETRRLSQAASYAQLTPGEIGCFESHRRAWQKIVDKNLPAALVLEDDVAVSSDFATLPFSIDILKQVDLVKLDYDTTRPTLYGQHSIELAEGRKLVRLLCSEPSCGCYLLTNTAARTLLKKTRNYMLPVDTMLFSPASKLFWDLRVLKLIQSAAIQLTMLENRNQLPPEIIDRIQGSPRPEQEKNFAAKIRRLRVQIRRVIDLEWATRRRKRILEQIAHYEVGEGIQREPSNFFSLDLSHYYLSRQHLG